MSAWLGAVSAEHVRRAVDLGIAQIGHGKRFGLARMKAGDVLVYYSPVKSIGDRDPLREFTALGVIEEGEIWQADEGASSRFGVECDTSSSRPFLSATYGVDWH
ncbi:hypothetical protein GCM10020255_107680 [Rhodococcus baikonurensis]